MSVVVASQGALAAFFAQDAETVAQGLIGATLLVDGAGGVIVETEAYDHEDPASHSFNGPTGRNASMFRAGGCVYVYRSYGIHWCLNAVCGSEGMAAPCCCVRWSRRRGIAAMQERRGVRDLEKLCSGPGRLCQALGISGCMTDWRSMLLRLRCCCSGKRPEIAVGSRIGITKGAATPWRFGLAGSRFLSRPFR